MKVQVKKNIILNKICMKKVKKKKREEMRKEC